MRDDGICASARNIFLRTDLMNEPPNALAKAIAGASSPLPGKEKRQNLGSAFFLWLGRRFLKITFTQQEDDPIVDVDEIRQLLDEDVSEGNNE